MQLKSLALIGIATLSVAATIYTAHTLNSEKAKLKAIQATALTTPKTKATTSAVKKSEPKKAPTSEKTDNKTLTAEAAFNQYVALSQTYLSTYLAQTLELKAPPKNIDKNESLAPLSLKFGKDGTPDVAKSAVQHLLFDPYIYKDPKMSYSEITSKGDGLYNGLLTVTPTGIDPVYIQFEYDTTTNLLTPTAKLVKVTDSTQNGGPEVPSEPIIKELE